MLKEIEQIYGVEISGRIAQAISYADTEDFFDDERRALAYVEIKDPFDELGETLLEEKAIPIVDAYDNTYVVYMVDDEKWALYSSIDGVFFRKSDSLEEVL